MTNTAPQTSFKKSNPGGVACASRAGLGTWAIGGLDWGGTDRQLSIRTIQVALDCGITLFDTAPIYGFGLAEEILGEALYGKRHQCYIASKCGLRWDTSAGAFFFDSPKGPVRKHHSTKSIVEEIHATLRRLKTDYIDLYQIHFSDGHTPVESVIETMKSLIKSGDILKFGLCNTNREEIIEYNSFGVLHSIQERFNLLEPSARSSLFPLAQSEGLSIMAYSPLAMGLLSGRITQTRKFTQGDIRRTSRRFAPDQVASLSPLIAYLTELAQETGYTLSQLAIGWILSHREVSHVLLGARQPQQICENSARISDAMSNAILSEIDRLLTEHDLKLPSLF